MEMKHSGMGIASFIVSLVGGAAMMVLVVFAGILEVSTPGGIDENSAVAMGLGLLLILSAVVEVIAAALGIAALAQRGRKKVFGILGLVFSVAAVIGLIALVIIGNLQ